MFENFNWVAVIGLVFVGVVIWAAVGDVFLRLLFPRWHAARTARYWANMTEEKARRIAAGIANESMAWAGEFMDEFRRRKNPRQLYGMIASELPRDFDPNSLAHDPSGWDSETLAVFCFALDRRLVALAHDADRAFKYQAELRAEVDAIIKKGGVEYREAKHWRTELYNAQLNADHRKAAFWAVHNAARDLGFLVFDRIEHYAMIDPATVTRTEDVPTEPLPAA